MRKKDVSADANYYRPGYGGPDPVVLILDRTTGESWCEPVQPGETFREVLKGDWAMWPLGSIPTPDDVQDLRRNLKTALARECKRPGSEEESIAEACLGFESSCEFMTASEFLDCDERWFRGRYEADFWEGTHVEINGHRINGRTSQAALAEIARAIRASARGVIITDLDEHLRKIRSTCAENRQPREA